jgi:L-galactose dehydrogenase
LALCQEYGVALSEVAIRYAVSHPDLATTIVGMSHTRHVQQNIRALDLRISEDLLERIELLVAPVKNMMWYEGKPENNIAGKQPVTK